MHIFYIDVPYDYPYDWRYADNRLKYENLSETAVRVQTGASEVMFICNGAAEITKGDCFRVTVPTEADELFYLIRTGFSKVDTSIATKWASIATKWANDHKSKYI